MLKVGFIAVFGESLKRYTTGVSLACISVLYAQTRQVLSQPLVGSTRHTPHAGWRKLGVVKDRVDAQKSVDMSSVRETAGRRHCCSRGARAFPLAY